MKKIICFCFTAICCNLFARGQCPTRAVLWDSLIAIENSTRPVAVRLQQVNDLKQLSDRCHLPKDSIYARLLHRIGLYEYTLNSKIPTTEVIGNTLEAVAINTSGRKDCSPGFAVTSYANLGHYYGDLGVYSKALAYYDTSINYAQKTGNTNKLLEGRYNKVRLFVRTADYQQAVDESTIGLALARDIGSTELIQQFLNQRAVAFLYQGQSKLSLTDADSALSYDSKVHDDYELATVYQTKAMVYGFRREFSAADALFGQAIRLRMRTADYEQIANDYVALGNYYQDNLQDYARAGEAYYKAMYFAGKVADRTILSNAWLNLGVVSFRRKQYAEALQRYETALAGLTGRKGVSLFSNPDLASLRPILNRHTLLMIFVNKLDASIHLYRQNNNRAYLDLSIQTALLADSLVTMLRHEQIGEQSKLYWRNKTREIFANALDACYFSGNTALAFLFMEKSRAVILNDKLNELGAQAQLPMKEVLIQRQLEVDLTSLQQTVSSIPADSPNYTIQQLRLLHDREKFEGYVRSLENKYPVYYQYKYADSVPSLSALQAYLAENKTTFLHFFTTDTVTYILCIEASAARLFRLPEKVVDQVRHFLIRCADEQQQNTGYTTFAIESHHLYELLFQPLSVTPGRVIVCSDDFLLPFEALYKDKEGKQPLLNDYAFSYVYSARSLLKTAVIRPAKGNFIGFAPVSFVTGLHLADLTLSADSLRSAAAVYQQTDLYTNTSATRNNFLQKMSGYAVANVFSHAQADSNGNEPVLFMQDSIIHLSELQLLPFPATQLVVLSACQTGAGRNASGEGIYSLARGFSSAGIPAVAATLWEADESAIYAVSARFHYYLSRGEPKDIALQKAKLDYIRSSDRSAMLPWYWANLIIIGNTAPVRLTMAPAGWWIVAAVLIMFAGLLAGGYLLWKQRR